MLHALRDWKKLMASQIQCPCRPCRFAQYDDSIVTRACVLQRSAVEFLRRSCDIHANSLVHVDLRGRGLSKVPGRRVVLSNQSVRQEHFFYVISALAELPIEELGELFN